MNHDAWKQGQIVEIEMQFLYGREFINIINDPDEQNRKESIHNRVVRLAEQMGYDNGRVSSETQSEMRNAFFREYHSVVTSMADELSHNLLMDIETNTRNTQVEKHLNLLSEHTPNIMALLEEIFGNQYDYYDEDFSIKLKTVYEKAAQIGEVFHNTNRRWSSYFNDTERDMLKDSLNGFHNNCNWNDGDFFPQNQTNSLSTLDKRLKLLETRTDLPLIHILRLWDVKEAECKHEECKWYCKESRA